MNRCEFLKTIAFIVMLLTLNLTAVGFMKNADPRVDNNMIASIDSNPGTYDFREPNGDPGSSIDCLSCHDGVVASDSHMTPGRSGIGNAPAIGSSHPVMINYSESSNKTPGKFTPPQILDSRIKLFNDRIECLSCHNPDSDKTYHLVMDNFRSRLCLSCHNK